MLLGVALRFMPTSRMGLLMPLLPGDLWKWKMFPIRIYLGMHDLPICLLHVMQLSHVCCTPLLPKPSSVLCSRCLPTHIQIVLNNLKPSVLQDTGLCLIITLFGHTFVSLLKVHASLSLRREDVLHQSSPSLAVFCAVAASYSQHIFRSCSIKP